MMVIKLRCKNCFAKISAEDDLIGKQVYCPACNTVLNLPTPQFGYGKLIGGFQVEQWLGAGAMGEVYMARQVSMNRPIALKIMKNDPTITKSEVDRFLHEAQTLARLNHVNIVPAYAAGEFENCHYLAMGYVDGMTLEDRLRKEKRIAESDILKIASKLSDALSYAWEECRMLHRDIKPANVMIDGSGEVKLMDFGIAKNLGDDGGLTKSGFVVGTPFYMSPEQAQGSRDIDFRSDLYALGATLYHLVTGRMPFSGPNLIAILSRKISNPPPPPHEIATDLSPATSAMIMRLMAFEVKDRPASFADLNREIAECQKALQKHQRRPHRATTPVPPPAAVPRAAARTREMPQPHPLAPYRKQIIVLAVLLILMFFILLFLLLHDKKAPDAAPPTQDAASLSASPALDSADGLAESGRKQFSYVFIAEADSHFRNKLKPEGDAQFSKTGEMKFSQAGGFFSGPLQMSPERPGAAEIAKNSTFGFTLSFVPDAESREDKTIACFTDAGGKAHFSVMQKGKRIRIQILSSAGPQSHDLGEAKIKGANSIQLFVSPGKCRWNLNGNRGQGDLIGNLKSWSSLSTVSFGMQPKNTRSAWKGDISRSLLYPASASLDDLQNLQKIFERRRSK
ncbi:MAG: hypothetical protein RL095_3839 [Verrucomicrobiota bacterium]|jgi:serine/threonine-protein kinase